MPLYLKVAAHLRRRRRRQSILDIVPLLYIEAIGLCSSGSALRRVDGGGGETGAGIEALEERLGFTRRRMNMPMTKSRRKRRILRLVVFRW